MVFETENSPQQFSRFGSKFFFMIVDTDYVAALACVPKTNCTYPLQVDLSFTFDRFSSTRHVRHETHPFDVAPHKVAVIRFTGLAVR